MTTSVPEKRTAAHRTSPKETVKVRTPNGIKDVKVATTTPKTATALRSDMVAGKNYLTR